MADQNRFLQIYAPLANDIAARTGLDATVVLGLIDLESAGGTRLVGNNIYGISPTRDGRQYVERYPDVETATEAFVNLVNKPQFAAARAATNPQQQAALLARGGYNTVNPNWAPIVGTKAQAFGKTLGYQDAAPAQPAAVAPAAPAAPAATTPAAPASSPKARALAEVGGGDTAAPTPPPAPAAAPAAPQSARARALAEVDSSQQDPTFTGPKTPEKTTTAVPAAPTVGVDEYGRELGPGGFPVGDSPLGPGPATVGSVVEAFKSDQNMRSALAPAPNTEYGSVLPYAIDKTSGEVRWALPSSIRDLAQGGYELTQGPATGGVTPGGTNALLNMAMGGGLNPSPGAGFGRVIAENALRPRPAPYPEIPAGGWRLRPEGAPDPAAPPAGPAAPDFIPPGTRPPPVPPPEPPAFVPPTERPIAAQPPTEAAPIGGPRPGMGGGGPRPGMGGAAPEGEAVNGWRPMQPGEALSPGQEVATSADGRQWVRATEPTGSGPSPGMGGGVGADVTTSPIPPKTPVERVRDLEKAVLQTAEERAGPRLVDNAPYVPGIPARLLPSRDFSKSVNALDAKVASARDPAFRDAVDANARVRNEGMVDHLREGAGDLTALEQAHEARSAVSPSAMRVFEGEKPVDAAGLLAKIDETLNGAEGKQKAVRTTLSDVRASLFDSEGNLETMPSRLYGARRNLTDLLKKGVKGTGDLADDVRASKHILNGLLEDFDPLITNGAPRFTEYLNVWSEASKLIDQMEFLQSYFSGSKKITNDAGYLQPGKVQKMFDDVLQGHKARGVNKAKSLTDEQIARIEAVRNELQADQLRDRLASVRGSDTFQQFNSRMFGDSPLAEGFRHVRDIGLGAMTGGVYNLGVKPIMETNRLRRIERKTDARKRQLLEEGPRNALGPD